MARQFRALPLRARWLVVSLPVIVVILAFALRNGGPSLEPLGLDPGIPAFDRADVLGHLQAQGIEHELRGSEILVPADRKLAILAQLAESPVIGPNQIDFNKLMPEDSPFRTQSHIRQRYLIAKMNVLGRMISQMSGIQQATVVLDQPEGVPGIGTPRVQPSACVNVTTTADELTQIQVDAIAHLVAGSHAGLKPQNVVIIDVRNGRALYAHNDDGSARDITWERAEAERHVKVSLEDALSYIPGVRVTVKAQIDSVPNEQSILAYNNNAQPSRQAIRTTAVIGVPRSYFIHLHEHQQSGSTAEADQSTQLDWLIEQETKRIETSVAPLMNVAGRAAVASDVVTISVIPDAPYAVASAVESVPINQDVLQRATYACLGAVAAACLIIVVVLFRRAGGRDMEFATARSFQSPRLSEAWPSDEPGGLVDDEGTLRNQQSLRRTQMLHELTGLVHDSPAVEAQFVCRWIESQA
ncbi:MAG: hypothetical protein L0Y44_09975 [Phycisphaerales bacterium]|nr:hypothetical protein [Phycisphaerales bacterium]MCI0630964.1 hypothetical protein [Phycisphaerales bacterium]MCI0674327.1 hypothetical protein [Phycisphaerales bacterium]